MVQFEILQRHRCFNVVLNFKINQYVSLSSQDQVKEIQGWKYLLYIPRNARAKGAPTLDLSRHGLGGGNIRKVRNADILVTEKTAY